MPQSQPVSRDAALQRLRTISHVMDNAIPIPGTTYRVGIDPLLGLLPGAGDVAGSALSAYIILEAARFGLPRSTLTRMLVNLVLDSVFGSLPIIGDFFDATWKANSRNLALLEAHVAHPRPQQRADRAFLVVLVIALVAIVLGVATVATLLVSLIWRAING
ncbi:DUF4112 domain-containing protein [Leptolyngbya sp. FACHB-36]|uniref:DUF4112 domain-containing protein n=1 Tax=Leptolyngbya sp. FACHB-36 TaxID=2692808 RepID=UPI001680D929|nr:DUF4112 domain-containing protein [Leptolyngbya sp. FACHB-36]MBD2022131.1 DUF4112 domain-containing protein [Leptolyngbya sp. FACHB-36]